MSELYPDGGGPAGVPLRSGVLLAEAAGQDVLPLPLDLGLCYGANQALYF